jgi:hypothetical protein
VANQLNPGDEFLTYTVSTADGRKLNIPADLKREYAVSFFIAAFGDPIVFGS